MLAHIAGIPVEETLLSLAPLTIATASLGVFALRERLRRAQTENRFGSPKSSASTEP